MKKLFLLLLLSLGLASISYAANSIITTPKKMTDSQLKGWLSGVSSWRYDYQKTLRDDKAATQSTKTDEFLALTPDELLTLTPDQLVPDTPAPAPPPAEEAPAEVAPAPAGDAPGSDMSAGAGDMDAAPLSGGDMGTPAPAPAPGKLTPDQLAAAPAPATDQLTPASAPAPVNDDLCGAEESTDTSDGVNINCSGDVEITEAPAPEATRRPDMFSTAVVKYATTVTEWAEMGIPADITKKYLNDPTAGGKCDHECMTNIPTAGSNAAKAEAVAAAEAASAAAAIGAVTAALNEAKAAAVAAGEAASAADRDSACSRLPEGETADYC